MNQGGGRLDYTPASQKLDYKRYDTIRKNFLEADFAYAITISPILKDYEGVDIMHNIMIIELLSNSAIKDFYLVPESADKRWHYHGMLLLKRSHRKDCFKILKKIKHNLNIIGYTDIPKSRIHVQWLDYIHKDKLSSWLWYDKTNLKLGISKDFFDAL